MHCIIFEQMLALAVFILLVVLVAVAVEVRERRRKKRSASPSSGLEKTVPEGCCGEHLVCEKETLLASSPETVYYDDEELDALAGIPAELFNTKQHDMISSVFFTLREEDVAGWCRSLQMRGIELPQDIREQALLVVKEQRQASRCTD